ncbi:hypothetical protein VPH35_043110 [Triticum aestivum]
MQAVAGIRRGLTIDPAGEEEAPAQRFGRLVRESPVVIFARRGCYMAHVMKSLLAAVGVYVRSRVGWCVCGRVRARRKYKGLFVRPEAFVRREISCPLPLSCFFFISGDRRGSVSRLDNNTHATVIELEGPAEERAAVEAGGHAAVPALFVGGAPVGGLEGLMGLHLSGLLVPRLREVGALRA